VRLERVLAFLAIKLLDGHSILHLPENDLLGIREPNVLVRIHQELRLHLQDFDASDILEIVADLHALHRGVLLVFTGLQ